MAKSNTGIVSPTTLRGALLMIFVALIGVAYSEIVTYTIGGYIVGIIFAILAFIVGLLIFAPYIHSKDPLVLDLQKIDKTLLPYLPLLIQLLPVLDSALQMYGPDLATLLNQLLANQAQRNKNQVQPPGTQ